MKIYSLLLIFALLTYINNTEYCGDEDSQPSSVNDCKNKELDPDYKEAGYDACCLFKVTEGVEGKMCLPVIKSKVKDAIKEFKDKGYKGVSIDCGSKWISFSFLLVIIIILF